ncbi:hypothetical protein CRV03_03585 [Arcobacter sp. F155]|uniref:response regulator transcription factor n=1 Tax=Arcobacter sp. F155 TaxID=2044512 RepID=UPI00100AAA50|nr:response regulator transcription factor [Arcobacter sp. F155]RXJ78064.1 hypothetical protein CRV03_03585 [Arcobacter sp. F155]
MSNQNYELSEFSIEKIKTLNVLYAEDDLNNQTIIAKALDLYCNDVLVASNGEEALYFYESNKEILDILVIDISMPKVNGLEVIKKIRTINKKIPIIITTAHTDNEYLLEALKYKLESYIVKPFSFEKLMSVFEEYIQREFNISSYIQITDSIKLNLTMNELEVRSVSIKLEPKEFKFLSLLTKNINKIVAYDVIEYYVYGEQTMSKSAIRTIVSNLNKKLGSKFILNYSNEGYMFFRNND